MPVNNILVIHDKLFARYSNVPNTEFWFLKKKKPFFNS